MFSEARYGTIHRHIAGLLSCKGAEIISWAATIVFLLCYPVTSSAQPQATVAGDLERYDQFVVPPQRTAAAIYAAKGEYESFQIIVRAGSPLTGVNVPVPDLVGPGGQIISKSNLTLFSEHYVYVSQAISSAEAVWHGANLRLGPGWYPDGLVPFNDPITGASLSNSGAQYVAVPFNLSANTNQGIWVDVFVPRTATAGVYTGTFVVTSNQGQAFVTLSLTVWNFTVPLKPTLKSDFNYWRGSQSQTTMTSLDTKNTDILLNRNRLMNATVNPPDEGFYIDNYGLVNTALTPWSGANAQNCSMSPAPSVATIQSLLAQHQPDVFISMNIADEIGSCTNLYPTIQQWAANLHQAGVSNLIVMPPTTALFSDGTGSGRSAVDIWVLLPFQYDAEPAVVGQAMAKGDQVWSYNALMQDRYSPKWVLDYAPINFRIQPGFINQNLGLRGLTYWRIDQWTADPWNDINTINVGGYIYSGEGMMVYPGAQVGINGSAPSIRLKYLRDGSDDFEYIEMLKNLGYGSWALQVAQTVGPNWTNWTRDPNALENARIQLGQKLDQLNGGGSTTTSLSISSPGNNSTVSGSLNITTNTSNIVRAELSIDNVYKSTVTSSPFNFTWDTTSVGNGTHTITVVGYNASSQTSISSVTVNVSNGSLLSLSISSPVSGASVSGTITVTPLVSANVVRVEYTVDGSYQATAYSSPFTFNWNTTSVGNGNHSITVVAYDASWNNRIVSVPVAVNNSLPPAPVITSALTAAGTVNTPFSYQTT